MYGWPDKLAQNIAEASDARRSAPSSSYKKGIANF